MNYCTWSCDCSDQRASHTMTSSSDLHKPQVGHTSQGGRGSNLSQITGTHTHTYLHTKQVTFQGSPHTQLRRHSLQLIPPTQVAVPILLTARGVSTHRTQAQWRWKGFHMMAAWPRHDSGQQAVEWVVGLMLVTPQSCHSQPHWYLFTCFYTAAVETVTP